MSASFSLPILTLAASASHVPGWLLLSMGAIVAAVVAALIYGQWCERQRTKALQTIAQEMGLEFFAAGEMSQIGGVALFHLFSQGHSKTIINLMLGPSAQVTLAVFDYRYTTGGGKSQTTYFQTVISFSSDRLLLPKFVIRPEHWFDKIGSLLGFQDIDFPDFPEFSRHYLLRGDSEPLVRKLFREDVIRYFQAQEDLCAEGFNNQLILYRANRRLEPEKLKSAIQESFELYKLFLGKS